jgi:hypothetical protein
VHFSRSLCTNVAREAWRAAGTSVGRAMCWRSSMMRCAGSTGSAVGVSNSPGILSGSPYTSSAFRVRWKRSTRPFAAGWWAVVLES